MTNQDMEACKRDIEIIKSTIERSKVNLGSMALLFIIYGATVLVSNIFCPPATMYLDVLRSFFPWIRYIVLAALLIFSSFCTEATAPPITYTRSYFCGSGASQCFASR